MGHVHCTGLWLWWVSGPGGSRAMVWAAGDACSQPQPPLESGSEVRWKDAGAWCSCRLAACRGFLLCSSDRGADGLFLASVQAGLSAPEIQGSPSHV